MISLDHLRIGWRRSLCSIRASFTILLSCATWLRGWRASLLGLVLVGDAALLLTRELSGRWLTADSSVGWLRTASSWLIMCDNIVCGSSVGATLAVRRHLVVCVVGIRVLQDHVPGVE